VVTKARHTSVIWWRRALAGGFALFALAVAGLYWWGRSQRGIALVSAPEGDAGGAGETEKLVLAGEGFAFELTDHGRKVFGVEAARIVSREENDFALEGVILSVEREGGGVYRAESERALYNAKTKHAVLEGKVVLEGPNGVLLRTAALEMRRHGRYLMSTSPVTFEFGGDYVGHARQLEANFRSDEFLLAGDVRVRSQPGTFPALALDARRVSYERQVRRLQADGDVLLSRGEDRLAASRVTLQLAGDERTPEQLEAFWDVRLEATQDGDDGLPHRLGAEAHEVRVAFDAAGTPLRADLHAGPHPVARARVESAGLVRELEARELVASFADRRLAGLSGEERVQFQEVLAAAPAPALRLLCGEALALELEPSGEVAAFTVDGWADLVEPWTQARTPRLSLEQGSRELLLEGPGTWVARDGLRVASPRIGIDPDSGDVRATDGVRADLERGRGLSLGAGGTGEEPVHVVAEEASWRPEEGFRFEQSVRAWQGPNYLLAQTLGGDGESFTASGPIKTVWETASARDTTSGREVETEDEPAQPLEITSQALRYSRRERLLVYEGSARARRGTARMLCREIRLHLDADDELELMECLGPMQIDDPESGSKVFGEVAEYRPALDKVRVTGDPVRLLDREGAQFEGRAVFYEVETGIAELASQAGGADDPFGPIPEAPAPPAGETAAPAAPPPAQEPEDEPPGRPGGPR
jgi:lipopolysaccharide export system protein LptA